MDSKIKMRYLILSASIFLTGCATNNSSALIFENQHFYHPEGSNRIILQWIRVSDKQLQTICGPKDKKFIFDKVFLGCAAVSPSTANVPVCVIYTSTNTTHQIFGHELRHCFQGRFHD
jgi:hypothetical protein